MSVSRAAPPVANDCVDAIAVRPTMAPTATAVMKSVMVHCASVRRCPTRRPRRATAYMSAAFPATTPRCGQFPMIQFMR